MAERHVVFALRRKYAELKGLLKYEAPAQPETLIFDLHQVGNVLRMFSPTEDLAAIPARRPYKPGRSHSWTRTALDVLRREGRPMSGRALARAVMIAEGLEPKLPVLSSVECSLHSTLARLEGRGIVREEGEPKRWRIA
jgi:hypothetical protein